MLSNIFTHSFLRIRFYLGKSTVAFDISIVHTLISKYIVFSKDKDGTFAKKKTGLRMVSN